MYDFCYNFIKKPFDAELLFTDTDSLTYEIKSDVNEEFFKHLFGSSELQPEFFDKTNKKVAAKIKDVHKGKPISTFVRIK